MQGAFMNPLSLCSILLFCGALVSCAHAVPRASIGDFTDQILEPLALRVADEKVSEAGAEIKSARTPKASIQTLASVLNELPWIGRLLNVSTASRKAALDQDLAWLETRRMPLKRELLDLFVRRTIQEEDTFAFCVNGVERRYQAIETNRFTRLPDGSGPCEITSLSSLRKA
jgi:hypothetical protein